MKFFASMAAATAVALACSSMARADTSPLAGDYTFNFVGKCDGNCVGVSTATLKVEDYVVGTALTSSNLVDFTYQSSSIFFNIDPSTDTNSPFLLDTLSGSIGLASGSYDIFVDHALYGFETLDDFASYSDGQWTTINGYMQGGDLGTTGVWNASGVSAAPEPAAWALMLTGVALIGGMLRLSRYPKLIA